MNLNQKIHIAILVRDEEKLLKIAKAFSILGVYWCGDREEVEFKPSNHGFNYPRYVMVCTGEEYSLLKSCRPFLLHDDGGQAMTATVIVNYY